jgi:outer membrane lipoprotein-sorting protein
MDGKTIPYKIRVNETKKSTIKFAAKDKGKINQTVIYSPEYVTKLIYVDKDADNVYDTYIVLRYEKDPNDSFEFKPTKRGFTVEVNKKYVEYIFGEGVYFVNNKDADYFFVTEFDEY